MFTTAHVLATAASVLAQPNLTYEKLPEVVVKFDAQGKPILADAERKGLEIKSGDRVRVQCNPTVIVGHIFNYTIVLEIEKKKKEWHRAPKHVPQPFNAQLGIDFSVGVTLTLPGGERGIVSVNHSDAIFTAVRDERLDLAIQPAAGGALIFERSTSFTPVHDREVNRKAGELTAPKVRVVSTSKDSCEPTGEVKNVVVTIQIERPLPPSAPVP
jgi:hypothetical protein